MKGNSMKMAASILKDEKKYKFYTKMMRFTLRKLPKSVFNISANKWARNREMPPAAKESFRDWFMK